MTSGETAASIPVVRSLPAISQASSQGREHTAATPRGCGAWRGPSGDGDGARCGAGPGTRGTLQSAHSWKPGRYSAPHLGQYYMRKVRNIATGEVVRQFYNGIEIETEDFND